jgi:hydrogenase nickel incorporation protein HypA/HybF
MHELHLAEDILRKIEAKAREEDKEKVSLIKIALGKARFTHLEELKELLAQISKDTVAEGARIEFEIIPVKTACADCKAEFSPKTVRLDCEKCGSTNIQITSGNELIVKELKV